MSILERWQEILLAIDQAEQTHKAAWFNAVRALVKQLIETEFGPMPKWADIEDELNPN